MNQKACIFYFYKVEVESKTLCELFDVPPSTWSRVLRKHKTALAKPLKLLPEASVCWPSFPEQPAWAAAEVREPLVQA